MQSMGQSLHLPVSHKASNTPSSGVPAVVPAAFAAVSADLTHVAQESATQAGGAGQLPTEVPGLDPARASALPASLQVSSTMNELASCSCSCNPSCCQTLACSTTASSAAAAAACTHKRTHAKSHRQQTVLDGTQSTSAPTISMLQGLRGQLCIASLASGITLTRLSLPNLTSTLLSSQLLLCRALEASKDSKGSRASKGRGSTVAPASGIITVWASSMAMQQAGQAMSRRFRQKRACQGCVL